MGFMNSLILATRLSRSSSYSHLSKMPSSPSAGPTPAPWPLTSVGQAFMLLKLGYLVRVQLLEKLGPRQEYRPCCKLLSCEGCCSVVLEPLFTLNLDVQYAMALDCMLSRSVPQTDTIQGAFKISEYAIRCARVSLCERPI